MKLVKEEIWWKLDCKNCNSKLEAEPSDVMAGLEGGSYCENGERIFFVECPKCGQRNKVPDGKLTSRIMNEAEARINRI